MSDEIYESTPLPPDVSDALSKLSAFLESSAGPGMAGKRAAAASARAELMDAYPLAIVPTSSGSGEPSMCWVEAREALGHALVSNSSRPGREHLAAAAVLLGEAEAPS